VAAAAVKSTKAVKSAAKARPRKGETPVQKRRRLRRAQPSTRFPAMRGNLPNVQALGALVQNLDTGNELYSRKPDQERPIASVSKLAALLVVMDRGLELEGLTTIKRVDLEVARGGAPSRLLEGVTFSNRDLLHAALMGSDNRAVSALGRAVGLASAPFAAAMSKKATDLGLRHTRFREPTGLSPENVSTPRETIVLLREVMKHPVLGTIVRKLEYDVHPVARAAIKYVSTHKPAGRSNMQILGGKTGYNDFARYCLVLVVRVGGETYGMSFLGAEGRLTRFGDVARVADWIVSRKPKGVPRPPRTPFG
jgi:D-alanyl-D-alanine endopeptidase (penicillin-binding protein 7)